MLSNAEVLRSVILEDEGRPYQFIKNVEDWELFTIDGSSYNNADISLQQYINQIIVEPFDLSKDYMFRATLITLSPEETEYINCNNSNNAIPQMAGQDQY